MRRVFTAQEKELIFDLWKSGTGFSEIAKYLESKQSAGRDRRLQAGEEERLMAAASPQIRPLIVIAHETAMRQGELLSIRWQDVNLNSEPFVLEIRKMVKIDQCLCQRLLSQA